jgi:Flp pilus assembly protein TadB
MTPLDMATCAAVAIPCGLAAVACVGWLKSSDRADRAEMELGGASGELTGLRRAMEKWRERAIDAQGRLNDIDRQRDAANKRWSRAMHLLRTAEKQNRALVDAQLADELERLVA